MLKKIMYATLVGLSLVLIFALAFVSDTLANVIGILFLAIIGLFVSYWLGLVVCVIITMVFEDTAIADWIEENILD